ncbi:MAG: hypothetical protein AB7P02_20415 [Alphaproteobacteria bacterium]
MVRRIAAALIATVACAAAPFAKVAAADPVPAHPLVAYHAAWGEPEATRPEEMTIARMPGYIDVLILAFAKPDLDYRGDLDLSRTGLRYRSGPMLRDAVGLLRRRNPAVRVLVAVGGWGFFGWDRLDAPGIARLVADLGLDGVDVDFESETPGCAPGARGRIECATDAILIRSVERLRAALPRPLLLSVPGWSVGAYGEGEWRNARPRSPWTGSMLTLLRSPAADLIDHVAIMSYDAGPSYDPAEAFRAYRRYWSGPLTLGVQVPFDAARSPVHTIDVARRMARIARADPKGGVMLYALQVVPPGRVGPDNPDYRLLAAAICDVLATAPCDRLPP